MKAQLYSLTSVLDDGRWLTPRCGCFTPGNEPIPIVQGGSNMTGTICV
jgi:hypothetical protein